MAWENGQVGGRSKRSFMSASAMKYGLNFRLPDNYSNIEPVPVTRERTLWRFRLIFSRWCAMLWRHAHELSWFWCENTGLTPTFGCTTQQKQQLTFLLLLLLLFFDLFSRKQPGAFCFPGSRCCCCTTVLVNKPLHSSTCSTFSHGTLQSKTSYKDFQGHKKSRLEYKFM